MIKVLSENKYIFDKLGISKWHERGYDGSLGCSLTFERPYIYDFLKGQVENLWTDQYPILSYSDHAYQTLMVHLQLAPARKVYSVVDSVQIDGYGNISGFLVDTLIPWMLQNKPDTGFRSKNVHISGLDSAYDKIMSFCTFCNSAGNYDIQDFSDSIIDKAWLGIGAINSNFKPESYSSVSEYVDFSGIAPFYIPTTNGKAMEFWGTSCAAPFLSGQIALVNHFFIKHIGRSLSFDEMYNFIKSHCQDITSTGIGKDNKTGWGVFILPDPDTINPYDWINKESDELDMAEKDNEFKTWSSEAGQWATTNGILIGNEIGDYMLSEYCTREQMIVFLYRLYKLIKGT
jgi:hypothetical protein